MVDSINNTVIADYGWFFASTTSNMRWIQRLSDPNNFNSDTVRILQQQWKIQHTNSGVSFEWKDIPIVEE